MAAEPQPSRRLQSLARLSGPRNPRSSRVRQNNFNHVGGLDFGAKRLVDLREECKKRGLHCGGRKQELIDRLNQHENPNPPITSSSVQDGVQPGLSAEERSMLLRVEDRNATAGSPMPGTTAATASAPANRRDDGGGRERRSSDFVPEIGSQEDVATFADHWRKKRRLRQSEPGTSCTLSSPSPSVANGGRKRRRRVDVSDIPREQRRLIDIIADTSSGQEAKSAIDRRKAEKMRRKRQEERDKRQREQLQQQQQGKGGDSGGGGGGGGVHNADNRGSSYGLLPLDTSTSAASAAAPEYHNKEEEDNRDDLDGFDEADDADSAILMDSEEGGGEGGVNNSHAMQVMIKNGRVVINDMNTHIYSEEPNYADYKVTIQNMILMRVLSDIGLLASSRPLSSDEINSKNVKRWSADETRLFLAALSQNGCNFDFIRTLFPDRTHKQLKSKYKTEARRNPKAISDAMKGMLLIDDRERDILHAHAIKAREGGGAFGVLLPLNDHVRRHTPLPCVPHRAGLSCCGGFCELHCSQAADRHASEKQKKWKLRQQKQQGNKPSSSFGADGIRNPSADDGNKSALTKNRRPGNRPPSPPPPAPPSKPADKGGGDTIFGAADMTVLVETGRGGGTRSAPCSKKDTGGNSEPQAIDDEGNSSSNKIRVQDKEGAGKASSGGDDAEVKNNGDDGAAAAAEGDAAEKDDEEEAGEGAVTRIVEDIQYDM
eukprot:jgi/Bigna1/76560/fgenesh1_pg.42_\